VLDKWVCQTFIYGYIVTKYGCNTLKYIFPKDVCIILHTGILSDWNKFRGQNITIFIEKNVHIINSRNAYNICFSKKEYYGVVHNKLSKGTNIRRNKFKFKFKFFINTEGSIRNKCFIVVHFLCFKKGINFSLVGNSRIMRHLFPHTSVIKHVCLTKRT
jgi:hypothetical protein